MKNIIALIITFHLVSYGLILSQIDIEADRLIKAGYLHTSGAYSGALLTLRSATRENLITFRQLQNDLLQGYIGFGFADHNLVVRNSNTGVSALVMLEGGNGGKFWMYPDGKLYANNIGDIGAHLAMRWNPTTKEIGYTSSSFRNKSNIRPLTDDWSKILEMKPVTYTRPGDDERWEIGYIAEDLDALGLAPLIGYDNQGMPQYIHYEKIILYLVEIVKSQQQGLQELQSRIEQISRKKRRGNN